MKDLKTENYALKKRLQAFSFEAKNNEWILQRFLARELELLNAEGLGELLGILTEGFRSTFGLKRVSLVLADPDHQIRYLLEQAAFSIDMFPGLHLVDRLEPVCPLYRNLRRPRLGRFQERLHRAFFDQESKIESVAILPLYRRELLGSLNLGSDDAKRYTHSHAVDLLNRLATIASVCLENAINREHLIISGHTDPLTGLRNRRYLATRLDEEVSSALRYQQALSCLFIDADHFKQINDNYGHATGDAVLRELGRCLMAQLRASDVATRYGGEEFAVLLPRTTAREAVLLAERVRAEVEHLRIQQDFGDAIRVTVSVGVSTLPLARRSGDRMAFGRQLLDEADKAVYGAKQQGRNRVVSNFDGQASRFSLAR